jgi:hypothetical protein
MNRKTISKQSRGDKQWLEESEEKRRFALGELQKNPISKPLLLGIFGDTHTETLLAVFKSLNEHTSSVQAISEMKAAWQQKKLDENPDNQRVTVVLSPFIVKKIDRLATDSTSSRRAVIEWLVNDIEEIKAKIRDEYYKEKKKKLEDYKTLIERQTRKLNQANYALLGKLNKLQKENEDKDKQVNAHDLVHKELIYSLSKIEIAAEKMGVAKLQPAPDLIDEINDRYDELIERYNLKIKRFITTPKQDFSKEAMAISEKLSADEDQES